METVMQQETHAMEANSRLRVGARTLRWPLVVVFTALFAGGLLRVWDLGRFSFWTDEMFHVMSAKSYIENEGLDVPMKGQYTRAFPVTWLTAASFRVFGESEWSARLPFAVMNLGFILTGFLVLRRFFSAPIAALFAVGTAFSPLAIEMARECRMYTLFQWLYFGASAAFIAGMEGRGAPSFPRPAFLGRVEKRMEIRFWLLALSGALFVVSMKIHALTINFGITVVAYSLCLFLYTAVTRGPRQAVYSKYGLVLGLCAAVFIWFVIYNDHFVRTMFSRATRVNDWQVFKAYDANYYRYLLVDDYPGLVFLFPLGAYYLTRTYGRRGFFFAASFAGLILMHSLVFGQKSDRYIFYILPFFTICGMAVLEPVGARLAAFWGRWSAGQTRRQRLLALLCFLPAINLVAYPWAVDAVRAHRTPKFPDWKSIPLDVRSEAAAARLITTNPREIIYYFGSYPEAYIIAEVERHHTYEPGRLNNFIDLRREMEKPGETYFVATDWHFNNPAFMTQRMRRYVLEEMKRVPHSGDRRIVILRKKA